MNRCSAVFITLLLFGAGCSSSTSVIPTQPVPIACTMEAKQCPDGSYVGRAGPKCEFAACPTTPTPEPTPTPSPVVKSCVGSSDTSCGSGYQCIQDCGPPVVRVDSPPLLYHCQTDAVAKRPRMCPICLASNTMIATPNGDMKVTDLKIGMSVWSPSAQGKKVARTIIKVAKTPVPSMHLVIHLVLSDKRQVWVSPNHPIMDGRPVATLQVGDVYDGANIVSSELVPYWDAATYDLLPSGETGEYWANGILMGSTLK